MTKGQMDCEEEGLDSDLCLTRSGPSPCGSPGCLCGPSPSLHGSAAGPAASAGAAAPSLRSPVGADSAGPSLQVSERKKKIETS